MQLCEAHVVKHGLMFEESSREYEMGNFGTKRKAPSQSAGGLFREDALS